MKKLIVEQSNSSRKQKKHFGYSVIRCLLPLTVGLSSATAFAQCNAINSRYEVDLSKQESIGGSQRLLMSKSVPTNTLMSVPMNKPVQNYAAQTQQATKSLLSKKRVEQQVVLYDSTPLIESEMMAISPMISEEAVSGFNYDNEKYQSISQNKFLDVEKKPVSTFSVDVDSASFANVRRFINQGKFPPVNAVRTEEIVNYFDYQYVKPSSTQAPVKIDYELSANPWNEKSKLLKVALQAKDADIKSGSNVVFLIDVSGSMSSADKLPLLKKSLNLYTKQLTANDCVSIVTYAGHANMVLNATAGDQKSKINRVIEQLRAGGSTNGGDGLMLAYELAAVNYTKGGVNRVLLATDGDFNLGMSDPASMETFISKQRKTGIDLSVLGFGQGNYNDHMMETLSNAGNGNAAYIDNLQEAHKVLVNQMRANFVTVAYDTKVQLEFNPSVVSSYRLLGYENRSLTKRDFADDKKDAGDMGSGQSVTAIYELFFKGDDASNQLRYQKGKVSEAMKTGELGFVKLRYKPEFDAPSKLIDAPILLNKLKSVEQTSGSFKLAIAAAAFAEKLRNSRYLQDYSWNKVIALANSSKANDPFGYRHQFIQQLRLIKSMSH